LLLQGKRIVWPTLRRLTVLAGALILCCISATVTRGQMQVDTVQPRARQDTSKFEMSRSPLLAMGLSAVLPGAGQVYLGQSWKLPIIYGLMGGFLYGAYIQNSRYQYTRDSVDLQNARAAQYEASGDSALKLLASGQRTLADRYARVREFYRDDRDKWLIYAGLTYVATILDAYIAAHLYDFDVSDPGPVPVAQYNPGSATPYRFGLSLRF
jgi:hypothetical protein